MSTLHIPNVPAGEIISRDFTVTVNNEVLPVRSLRVTAIPFNTWWPGHQRPTEQTEFASYADFSFSGSVSVEIVCHTKRVKDVQIRPTALGITPVVDGQKITFTLDKPCYFTVEVNGWHNCLHLFADEPENYGVDIHDPNVIYFGPGVHKAGLIELTSGQTLYLDDGALVYGSVFAKDAEHIRVLGRGVIDSSPYKRIQEYTGKGIPGEEILDALKEKNVSRGIGNVLMLDCKDVVIDGPVFRDPPEWSYNIYHCEDVRIHGVKLIGLWRYNADGIDIYLGKNFELSHCFIRSFDDSIVARGACGPNDEDIFENMLVHDCVLWCEWGRALEMWTSARTAHLKNLVWRDCYILRTAHVAIDLQIYGSGTTVMENVLCENIYLDTDRHADRPIYQKHDAQIYENTDEDYLPLLFFIGNAYKFEKPLNKLGLPVDVSFTNVTFRNIRVNAHRMPQSIIKTVPGYMRVKDIVFDGVYLNGKPCRDAEEMNLCLTADAAEQTDIR
ncbi:MAG: hypothetical protein ACI4RV_05760 [Eubacteriales bacterium]